MRIRSLSGAGVLAVVLALATTPAEAKKPKLSITGVTVAEGNAGTASAVFTAKLSKKAKKSVSADYATVDGSATSPGDYAAAEGKVRIKRKKKSATITIAVAGDTVAEPDETFSVQLSKPKAAKLGQAAAEATIRNDDAAPSGADIRLAGQRVAPNPYRGGTPIEEHLTVSNAGPQGADGVALTDTMPAGATLNAVWSSSGCTAVAGVATCQIGGLASGASKTVILAMNVPHSTLSQNFTNTATAAAVSPADPVGGNATVIDSFTVPSASLTIGTSSVSMPRNGTTERIQEVVIGDAIADAFRVVSATDLAVQNAGGIRVGLTCNVSTAVAFCPNTGGPPFAITRGSIVATLPFSNRIATFSLSGTELHTMLENSVSQLPLADGRFLQISGFCFTWSQSAPVNSRVQSVVRQAPNGSCTGAAIPSDATMYTMATNDFVAAGGSSYQNFSGRWTLHGYDADAATDYTIANSPLSPVTGRITPVP